MLTISFLELRGADAAHRMEHRKYPRPDRFPKGKRFHEVMIFNHTEFDTIKK